MKSSALLVFLLATLACALAQGEENAAEELHVETLVSCEASPCWCDVEQLHCGNMENVVADLS